MIYFFFAVISRNILNDEASPLVPSGVAADDKTPVLAELQPAADMQRVERFDSDDAKRDDRKQEVVLPDDAMKLNDSTVEGNGVEPVSVDSPSPSAGGAAVDVDMTKPAHADEM